jgi:hypothetical protein
VRRISVTGLLVMSLLGLAPAATADVAAPASESTVALWDGALPDGVTTVQAACDGDQRIVGEPESLPATLEATPWTPSGAAHPSDLHRRALSMTADPGAVPGYEVARDSVLDVLTAGITIYELGEPQGGLRVDLDVATSDGPWHLSANGYTPSSGHTPDWTRYDTRSADYTWTSGDETASGTLDEFITAHGDGATIAHLWLADCPVSAGTAVGTVTSDGLRLGGDAVTTYDLEASPSEFFVGGPEYVPGSRQRTLRCYLIWSFPDGVVGADLAIEARPHGTHSFRQVGVATTRDDGGAVFHLRPRVTTDYRCRSEGGTTLSGQPYPAATSPVQRIGITTHLSVHARRIHHGKRVLVTGAADPRNPGTKVALHVRRIQWEAGRSRVVAHGRLSKRGGYRLTAPLPGGTWEVFVSVASARDNVAGSSASSYVR